MVISSDTTSKHDITQLNHKLGECNIYWSNAPPGQPKKEFFTLSKNEPGFQSRYYLVFLTL